MIRWKEAELLKALAWHSRKAARVVMSELTLISFPLISVAEHWSEPGETSHRR